MRVGVGFLFSWTPGDMAELKCPEGSGVFRGAPCRPVHSVLGVALLMAGVGLWPSWASGCGCVVGEC